MSEAAVSQGLAAILGLRQLVMEGELRAGDRLSEVRLAARLEVSRTPLRLALAQLEHEGLLEPVPGGGFVVRSFSGRQVLDAIELRGLLEGHAARLAALRNNGARALGDLVACVAKLDRIVGGDGGPPTGEEFELYLELNDAFHNELFVLADSDVLRGAYELVLALPFAQPSFFLPAQADTSQFEPTLAAGNTQHHEILNAIERGDADEAERLARGHAGLTVKNLESVLETGGLDKLPGSGLISDAAWARSPLQT
jgi:GntR family transcriptional regulator, vanillate catabolism transcriptional regulator